MLTIKTRLGKEIEILLQAELDDPIDTGDHVRAYCHLHGSDHQRSLSIDKASGWGHCFNAAYDATVLVADWNLPLARQLIQTHYQWTDFPLARHPDPSPIGAGGSHRRAASSARRLKLATRRTDHATLHAGVHAGRAAPLTACSGLSGAAQDPTGTGPGDGCWLSPSHHP